MILALAPCVPVSSGAADPLLSWNDTAPKKAIIAFVGKVTRKGSPDLLPVPERIAVFDNDGTLWAEQPMYFQFAFVFDRAPIRTPIPRPFRRRCVRTLTDNT
jgi:hypothetical protein